MFLQGLGLRIGVVPFCVGHASSRGCDTIEYYDISGSEIEDSELEIHKLEELQNYSDLETSSVSG